MHNQNKILRVLQLISLLKKEPAKSIRFLAGILESTDRTVYRYLDLVKELGFELQKDHNSKFSILGADDFQYVSFSNEEASLLRDLVLSTGKENKLRDSLLKKIYLKSELSIQGNHLLKANLGKMVEKIALAINEGKRVVLKDYHSINSQLISSRVIEPISFTDHYNAVCGFELDSKLNKYYNLERITEVIVLDESQKFRNLHQIDEMDAFGFSDRNGQKYHVALNLSLRGYILMKEEYPQTEQYFKKNKERDLYYLEVDVNNPKPVVRFILGLLDDIEVVGSEEFKGYLKDYVGTVFERKRRIF